MSARRITALAVHCAYTPPAMDIGAAEIDRWHKARGWDGIGYHFVLRRDGQVETARPLERSGCPVAGHNARSVGICLVGGKAAQRDLPENNFTPAQFQALRTLLDELLQRFPGADVLGHRDFPGVNKACPCFEVRSWHAGQAPPVQSAPAQQENFWPGIEHFRPSEFDRPMHPEFIRLLDRARRAAGVPFRVHQTLSDREALLRITL